MINLLALAEVDQSQSERGSHHRHNLFALCQAEWSGLVRTTVCGLCGWNDAFLLAFKQARHVACREHMPKALSVDCGIERLVAFRQLEEGLPDAPLPWGHIPGHQVWVVSKWVFLARKYPELPGALLSQVHMVAIRKLWMKLSRRPLPVPQ